MIRYPALTSNSVIDLVAPSSAVTLEQIQQAVTQVEKLGFKARIPSNTDLPFILTTSKNLNMALKFRHLKKALMATDSEAIWCIRGGYGSQKLMPYLAKIKKPDKPKVFIGYSDITVLQNFLSLKFKWPVLHFPVLTHVPQSSSACLKRFQNLLKGKTNHQSFLNLKILNPHTVKSKNQKIQSQLVGGNLTLIQSSIGTPWNFYFYNKILFLEDIGEAPYRIDRNLWQMLNAGIFTKIKALVLGDFIYPSLGITPASLGITPAWLNKNQQKNRHLGIKKVFQNFASSVSFPVIEGIPCGHTNKKEVLPFMTSCVLQINSAQKAELQITSPFVKK